ncbi:hypothetical protein LshimejAT787_0113150 [Lyophyllum shimeji]|uniref:Uncharacterized protein n=1 Tax=Lyophyllum shimeji TaxID=47721 RepID=A0A9P3PEK1_LYOSH|nr:hypothetical protein LshimejAT787_0113150 [Lyophyllum shimeji]
MQCTTRLPISLIPRSTLAGAIVAKLSDIDQRLGRGQGLCEVTEVAWRGVGRPEKRDARILSPYPQPCPARFIARRVIRSVSYGTSCQLSPHCHTSSRPVSCPPLRSPTSCNIGLYPPPSTLTISRLRCESARQHTLAPSSLQAIRFLPTSSFDTASSLSSASAFFMSNSPSYLHSLHAQHTQLSPLTTSAIMPPQGTAMTTRACLCHRPRTSAVTPRLIPRSATAIAAGRGGREYGGNGRDVALLTAQHPRVTRHGYDPPPNPCLPRRYPHPWPWVWVSAGMGTGRPEETRGLPRLFPSATATATANSSSVSSIPSNSSLRASRRFSTILIFERSTGGEKQSEVLSLTQVTGVTLCGLWSVAIL